MEPRPKKHLHTILRTNTQPEVFPLEVEQLLDVLAQIEKRRQMKLRASEIERKSHNATPENPS